MSMRTCLEFMPMPVDQPSWVAELLSKLDEPSGAEVLSQAASEASSSITVPKGSRS
jgi:hypothetical protein